MKFLLIGIIVFLFTGNLQSQNRVAILDFENTSGIAKYDGFGKALSNMLITDLKNSIHPRKITFLERSQLNKILSEQNLQKSKNFDKGTAVSFGKLAGVKYVLVGSVYVMDGTCNITSRLVDVQTSEIVHAKESNGKITNWLSLKSVLANELSTAMNNPVTIQAEYTNKETSEGVIVQYAKVIDKIDKGDIEGAQEMTEMLSSVQPDFKYFDELKLDIEQLKKQVKENTEDISTLKKSGGLIIGASSLKEYGNNLTSSLLSYDEKLDIVKKITLEYDSYSLTNTMCQYVIQYMDINEYPKKLENNIKYYNSLSSQRKKDLFLYYLNEELYYMMSKLTRDVNVSDEIIVELLKSYIKVQKLYYQLVSPPLLQSEFMYLKLSNISCFNTGFIQDSKNTERIISSQEFKSLRISVLNNMFDSQKNEDGIDSGVINYLQKYFSEKYDEIHGFSDDSDEYSYLKYVIHFKNLMLYNVRHRVNGKNKNISTFNLAMNLIFIYPPPSLKYSFPDDNDINSAFKELDLPFLYTKGQKIPTSFNKKVTDEF
jgi:TolB-like protein